jgi:hypothetical protein
VALSYKAKREEEFGRAKAENERTRHAEEVEALRQQKARKKQEDAAMRAALDEENKANDAALAPLRQELKNSKKNSRKKLNSHSHIRSLTHRYFWP